MSTTMYGRTTERVSGAQVTLCRLTSETWYILLLFYADHGLMVGSRCEFTCDKRLHHVFCNPISSKCECEKNYPVKIGRTSVSLSPPANLFILTFQFIISFNQHLIQCAHIKDLVKAVQNVSTEHESSRVYFVCGQHNEMTFNDWCAYSQKTRRTMLLWRNMPA